MSTTLDLGGIVLDVLRKDIKNVHLSVNPPTGSVRISAPKRMSLETIRLFAISKLGWIKREQKKLRAQERESQREFIDRESHWVWGSRYLLRVLEHEGPARVELRPRHLVLRVRPGTDEAAKSKLVSTWYRQQLREAAAPLIGVWESRLGVKAGKVFVQIMKTKWGSCNPVSRTIRLNTELAKKPRECLEYIIVHEMVHLLEPTHGPRYIALMDEAMPAWRDRRDQLDRLPTSHELWRY
jgi:hypothetical protein